MSRLTTNSRQSSSSAHNSKKNVADKDPPFLWDTPLNRKLLSGVEEEFSTNGGSDGGDFKTAG